MHLNLNLKYVDGVFFLKPKTFRLVISRITTQEGF